ncbi:hypothetical protein Q2K19_22195 [Micromonospora soli]|uniref:hypothetical protein n=1 Tax=Micromonospora sp. NBRC 110009 TaxID=3061627 RepID=UPI002673C0A9|nr:hypothetical protein [Micromonospora sp. NBRC 110009]WKT96887.1 hypothetical protein Q2K19_22195 [Micromonospora sp. NBRC 110009]
MVKELPGGEIIGEALDGVLSGLDTVEAIAADDQDKHRRPPRNDAGSSATRP